MTDSDDTEYLSQGASGKRLRESIAELEKSRTLTWAEVDEISKQVLLDAERARLPKPEPEEPASVWVLTWEDDPPLRATQYLGVFGDENSGRLHAEALYGWWDSPERPTWEPRGGGLGLRVPRMGFYWVREERVQ